jgi:hypothetical protein
MADYQCFAGISNSFTDNIIGEEIKGCKTAIPSGILWRRTAGELFANQLKL